MLSLEGWMGLWINPDPEYYNKEVNANLTLLETEL
jgi:hypothetical protein